MKRAVICILISVYMVHVQGQDYRIHFSGSGASSTINSVVVENLTQGKTITISGNDQLHLMGTATGTGPVIQAHKSNSHFYPNPFAENSLLSFDLPENGYLTIVISDFAGKEIAQTSGIYSAGIHSFNINGLVSGLYTITIISPQYQFSEKIISINSQKSIPQISHISSVATKEKSDLLKSAAAEVVMQYTTGDVLKFTGISDIYRTVKILIPTQDQTVNFVFTGCTDEGGKNYQVIQIGTQTWMAENLAYLPAVSPQNAGSYTEKHYYVYGYNGNKVDDAKVHENYIKFGVLYNWAAAMDGQESSIQVPSGVKGVCPTGWHLPSEEEWTVLEHYLIENAYNYDGTTNGNKISKSLAAQTGWSLTYSTGAPGNVMKSNNRSGFSGLPGGLRGFYNTFYDLGLYGYWWSSTEYSSNLAWYRTLYYDNALFDVKYALKPVGISVRCLKD